MKTKARYEFRPGPDSSYRRLPVIGAVLDELVAWYRRQGYSESTIRNHVSAAARLCRWLEQRSGRGLRRFSQSDLRAGYDHFRHQCVIVAAVSRSMGRFLAEHQLIHPEQPKRLSRSEQQIQLFGSHLRNVRGLEERTIRGHLSRIRSFLCFLRFDKRPAAIRTLDIGQIETFLRQCARTNNRFSMQHVVASLRAFLRYQHAQGSLKEPLHQRIERPRTYRLEQLPRALPWKKITALLRSIDQSTPIGLRDFTILYLAARYGLRSGELVRLTLDDIDWRAGVLKVRQTKSKQALLLPLTDEAGQILVRYLKAARPASANRELFLRCKSPAGALAHTAVHDVLERRIALSGLNLPPIGTHVFRHSMAVHLLARGVCLPTIGATLGHRDPESTAVYLRLATADLRKVGLPVPKAGRAKMLHRKGWKQRLVAVRNAPKQRLNQKGFHSGLAKSLCQYLETRRALGRDYKVEEAILRHWDAFLTGHYGKVRQVRPGMFQQWIQTMPALHATVLRNRMRIVRNFLVFHARQHPRTPIPDPMTFPKPSPHQAPRLVSEAEMAHVLATAARLPPSHQNPIRAQTIRLALILLFCCGLRRGELLRLRIRDCDPHENVLRIEGTKFHKSRLVPLSDSVAEEVQRYLALRRRRRHSSKGDAFLIWSNNRLASEKIYSASALADNWHLLCLATGVLDQRGRPPRLHDLRHSFAVTALHKWYRQGIDVQSRLPHLATYLGHVSPVSTYYYLRLSPDLQQAASQRFHQYAHQLFDPGDCR